MSQSSDALAHQQQLLTYLEEALAQHNGWISFADFMQIALYAPALGYYSAGMRKFGKEGDFVTAPEISPLFGQSLALQCLEMKQSLSTPDFSLFELGAGTGKMALSILQFLAEQNALPKHYYILEVSSDLRERQEAFLKAHLPAYYSNIIWLEKLPEEPISGVILANEVLDAMPVHRFKVGENHLLLEEFVGKERGEWVSRFLPTTNALLIKEIQHCEESLGARLPVGYTSEINLALKPWLKSLGATLKQGAMLFIDYGFPRHEYYHPSRNMGTLMCFTRHQTHADPFKLIGLQDITAHVDFTLLAEAGYECGLDLEGFTNQGAFLLNNDILGLSEKSEIDPLRRSQQIQMLTQPHEMGELFKVMAFSKDLSEPLRGFAHFDQLHRL